MFIDNNKNVDIVVYYRKLGYHYVTYSGKDFEDQEFTDEEKEKFKKLTVQMKQLSWGLYNELQENSVEVDSEGNRKFNGKKFKEFRLTRLISGWDATIQKDDKEVKINPNEQTIKSLSPDIAEAILNAYDQLMYLSEEEEKK